MVGVGLACGPGPARAQGPSTADKPLRLGVNYSRAEQSRFPFGNINYEHRSQGLKLQAAWTFAQRRRWDFELLLEPSVYGTYHRLVNPSFLQPWHYTDYEGQRARFSRGRNLVEFALNVGAVARWRVGGGVSAYGLASIGPMISGRDTERLRRGFAFSDILGLGLAYRRGRGYVDLRATVRHNSNAALALPNYGHNTAGGEVGVGWYLR